MGLYLGLDSSTQGLKAIIIDTVSGEIVASQGVNYTADLPDYECPEGVLAHADPLVKHADPLMWVAALDLVLSRLQAAGAPLADVAGISGSGQQHGSVYLNADATAILAGLDSSRSLAAQLSDALSRKTAPIWMDSSTSEECAEIAAAVGPRLQEDTGSPAVERFTGPQIRKFSKTDPGAYDATATVHLVSSFLASVLCGAHAGIDYGDGAGMNLLNLKTLDWDPAIAEATAPGLLDRLPPAVPSDSVVGGLHAYFATYGMKPGTPVAAWSGDNPNSLIGTGAGDPGTAVISLGTSDTFFAAMTSAHVDPQGCGHVFGNPAGGFMSLICFKNGSLARERVKDECGVDWAYFDRTAFAETAPGNDGNMMLPYFESEITPLVLEPGVRYEGSAAFCAGTAASASRIRAVVEAQALSMRLHSEWIGADFSTVRVTGGASKSPGLCQTLADVFQARLEKIAVADSAALGAALRAANAVGTCAWAELYAMFAAATETVEPNPGNAAVYDAALAAFREFETNAG